MLFLNFIWSLPAKILNSSTNSEPRGGRRKSTRRRRRPLHTCGASCLAIARKACTRAQDLDGPLGSTTKTCITYFNSFCPLAHTAVHRCLALLLIVDDHILSLETRIKGIFPRSSCLFDAVDELARRAEALPDNVDQMATKLPNMIRHYFPLLGWVAGCLIWIRSKNTHEKEIKIDVNCSNGAGAAEQTKLVQFEKPYSYADAARNVNQGETVMQKSVQFEEKKVANEVIHLSVKRLHSWKSRIKALEEPLSAVCKHIPRLRLLSRRQPSVQPPTRRLHVQGNTREGEEGRRRG
ncbi:hypothetical protein C2S51_028405 [Perilla frutescens var. frutescens]|nr:hypothetical protein C2S51_028405 [Perilla frutescens var. frutescens]